MKPSRQLPKKIIQITGISQKLVDREGISLESAVKQFVTFIGNLPLVVFNAEFDQTMGPKWDANIAVLMQLLQEVTLSSIQHREAAVS